MLLWFGRHKGKELEQLVTEDPNYLVWLADSHASPTIKELARQLLGLNAQPIGPPQAIDTEIFIASLADPVKREILKRFHQALWVRLDNPETDRTANLALHTLKNILANLADEAFV